MKRTIGLCLMLVALSCLSRSQTCSSAEHEVWISKAVTEMTTIRVGMTRGELVKVFTRAPGFFTTTRARGTYVYKGSSYIRVDVEFSPASSADSQHNDAESPSDVITAISKPYLSVPDYD